MSEKKQGPGPPGIDLRAIRKIRRRSAVKQFFVSILYVSCILSLLILFGKMIASFSNQEMQQYMQLDGLTPECIVVVGDNPDNPDVISIYSAMEDGTYSKSIILPAANNLDIQWSGSADTVSVESSGLLGNHLLLTLPTEKTTEFSTQKAKEYEKIYEKYRPQN